MGASFSFVSNKGARAHGALLRDFDCGRQVPLTFLVPLGGNGGDPDLSFLPRAESQDIPRD